MGFCNWKHCGNSLCRRFVSEPEMTCSGKKDEENRLPSRIFACSVCSFLICYICSYSFCQSRSCMILRRARWHPQCGLEESEWLYCELREARDALDPKARQPWISTQSFFMAYSVFDESTLLVRQWRLAFLMMSLTSAFQERRFRIECYRL